jgi:hypothetical protein
VRRHNGLADVDRVFQRDDLGPDVAARVFGLLRVTARKGK